MKHLHLIVDLPLPLDAAVAQMPALGRLLARARPPGGASVDQAEAACRALAIERQQDWPLAPLLAAADGLEVEDGYWLCAEPVAHEVGMNGLLLRAPAPALTLEEARRLAADLAEELAPLEGQLHVPDARHWYLRLPQPARLATLPLASALNRSVPPDWLKGEDAGRFLRLFNALQIGLHQHPINQARDEAGLLPVNGLWLWGGGVAVKANARPAEIWGEGRLARALAQAVGLSAQPLPACLDDFAAESVLAWIESPLPAHLDRDWFAPLAVALRWRRLHRLSLALDGPDGGLFELTGRAFWPWG